MQRRARRAPEPQASRPFERADRKGLGADLERIENPVVRVLLHGPILPQPAHKGTKNPLCAANSGREGT